MRTLNELLRLDGRVAVVTGGSGHIGLAIGETLAELGARVLVVDRAAAQPEQRAHELQARFRGDARGCAIDLHERGAGQQITTAALDTFGALDILINNAAFTNADGIPGYAVPFEQQTLEAWDAAFRVNLTAVFELCLAAREPLAMSGRGCIVNIGSIYGMNGPNLSLYEGTPMGNAAAYAASKGGLLQLTRYLATVLAPRVRVNALSPGGIERGQPASFVARYEELTPLKRMGTEEDMKGALAFLATDTSSYVTGINVPVEGGWTAW